jgi:hypothetical protein
MDRRKIIWSDRNAGAARGQEQNRVFVERRGPEQFVPQMVLASGGGAQAGWTRADQHFFLDFRLKPPYI